MESRSFVVACGGTGGHVFPGLVVARELRRRGHKVVVWLSGRAIEGAARGEWDGPVFATGARFLNLRTALTNLRAFMRCRSALRRDRPHALLAMGSYASLPPVVAAKLAGVPVVLHEANAVPGKAVDVLSRVAALTATSFDETARWLPGRNIWKTGLPVREDLVGQPRLDGIPEGVFTLFVTGGSQGARRVNELVSQGLCLLRQAEPGPFHVIHQTGPADEARVREAYARGGVSATVCAFMREMGRAYASADLVIARAGASTCFELCRLAKPALLIPLPTAVRDHQHANASALVRCGGADEGVQAELTPRTVMRYVHAKMRDPLALARMRQALAPFSDTDAAARLADALEAVVRAS